ncbi:EamA family transporter [Acidithiobacillus sp.]|uniref:DMT family transporter n=1 Tax=Acidithiobacillus sp. TaxID=1872118 RepID=UPI0036058BBB
MNMIQKLIRPGIPAAIFSALLFGASTPLAKILLATVSPWMLAALLYLGSGLGLSVYRLLRHSPRVHLSRTDTFWFGASVLAGGIIAPVLFMFGLRGAAASNASLLLNAESVFTTLLAWWVFKENFDRRIAWGMFAIVLGMVLLSWPGAGTLQFHIQQLWPAAAIIAACFAWGVDNNLTRKVSLTDSSWIAANKGWIAGSVNLLLALWLGSAIPAIPDAIAAMILGFFAYGVSLALFVVGLRHLGSARTGAYFSSAPFFGAILSVIILGTPVTPLLLIAAALMAWGIWMHLDERHDHVHSHEAMDHAHMHIHDVHHQHAHAFPVAPGTRHEHPHHHEPLTHSHPHVPDMHHLHKH